jgi:hypothetical protein
MTGGPLQEDIGLQMAFGWTNMYDVVVDMIKWRLGLKINKKKIVE